MKANAYDKEGYYTGQVECQTSPLEKGVLLIPAYSTLAKLPAEELNKEPKWDGEKWTMVVSRAFLKAKEAEIKAKLEETDQWGVKLYEVDSISAAGFKERPQADIDKDKIERQEKQAKDKCLAAFNKYLWVDNVDLAADKIKAIKDYLKAFQKYVKDANWRADYPIDPMIEIWS